MKLIKAALSAVSMVVLTCCGGGGGGSSSPTTAPSTPPVVTPPPVVATPTITSFLASPVSITSGASSALTGVFTNGTGVITPGNLSAPSGVAIAVTPTATTTYTLTVTPTSGAAIIQTAMVTVTAAVPPPVPAPVITSFLASPATITAGGVSVLTGVFSDGNGIVTPGNLAATSGAGLSVTPAVTTTYTLTNTNSAGVLVTQTATVTVNPVVPPPVAPTFGIFRSNNPVTTPATGALKAKALKALELRAASMGAPAINIVPGTGTVNMASPRISASATLLASGQVLIVGGSSTPFSLSNYTVFPTFQTSMEVFDPATESFYPVTGTTEDLTDGVTTWVQGPANLIFPRAGQASVLLDNGQVLFLGGDEGMTLETFDPATGLGAYHATTGLSQNIVAYNIGGGMILIYGQNNTVAVPPALVNTSAWTTTQLAGTFVWTDPSTTAAYNRLYTPISPASCMLQTGQVMVSGGTPVLNAQGDCGSSSTDVSVFNAATSTFVHLGNMVQGRTGHTMVDLGNGTVEIYGGFAATYVITPATSTTPAVDTLTATPLTSVEIFNYASTSSSIPLNTSVEVGNLVGAKYLMDSVILQNGFALHCGGEDQNGFITNTEIVYNTATNVSGYTGSMLTPRMNFTMTPLNNGLFLITGGTTSSVIGATGVALASAEVYDPQDHLYLTYPSLVLPYAGTETLTLTIPSGSPVVAPYTWTAAYGTVAPAADGLSATYTYPVAPAVPAPLGDGTQPPTPVIAFDTITVVATSGETVKATIGLQQ